MRYSQVAVLEGSLTLKFYMEILDVDPLTALEVYLSEALALLRISYGSKTGVIGGP